MEEKNGRTFFSDASRNYLVMECPPEMKDNYQYRMLVANQIRGLLPCSSRCIDNQEYLYYDITSRQSLEDLYDRRPVRGRDLEKLLEDLLRLEKTMTEYLLDSSHMILDPSCVYVDFRGQECSFLYYPGEVEEAGWELLFAFLADRVDGKDKRAAALIYRLCMMAEKPGFRLREEILEELGIQIGRGTHTRGADQYYDPVDILTKESAGPPLFGDTAAAAENYGRRNELVFDCRNGMKSREERKGYSDAGTDRNSPVYGFGEGEQGARRNPESREKNISGSETDSGGQKRKGFKERYSMVIAVIFLAAAGTALLLLGRFLILTERETLLSLAAGGFLVFAAILLAVIHLIRTRRGNREDILEDCGDREERGEETTGMAERRSGSFCGDNTPSARWDEYSPWNDYGGGRLPDGAERTDEYFPTSPTGDRGSSRTAENSPGGSSGQIPEGRQESGMPYRNRDFVMPGETCLLGPDAAKPMGLYGTGTCRGERISLANLPCVVGKMREYVDEVLDDSSVSRMHARFSIDQEGKMTVRDLNSTNGTWLNGERLRPNESRTMHQGDHVRLGRMEFVYR